MSITPVFFAAADRPAVTTRRKQKAVKAAEVKVVRKGVVLCGKYWVRASLGEDGVWRDHRGKVLEVLKVMEGIQ